MLTRIAPLALIAAILVCPLLCRNGRCQECCAGNQSVASACLVSEAGNGCCRNTSCDGEDQRPCDGAPGGSGCQGVCGGAVLEKPNSFPEPTEMRFRYVFNAPPSLPAPLLVDHRPHTLGPSFDGSMTPGRYIRTLYMSFLC